MGIFCGREIFLYFINKNILKSYNLMCRSSSSVVGKLLACEARGSGFDSRSRRYDLEICYLLLPSRNMDERSLSDVNPQNNQSTNFMCVITLKENGYYSNQEKKELLRICYIFSAS